MVRKHVHQGIGGELVIIERGTPVRNVQETIGSVDHLLADAESGEVTHLVMRRGVLPYYLILPFSAITVVSEQAIVTDLPEEAVNRLPRYRSCSADDIKREVRDRLAEFGFDVAMIGIHAEANVVKLTGLVSTVLDKRHAEAIVRSVEGVIEVENGLDTDEAIQTRVAHALLSDPQTVVSIIQVTAEQGVVTLKGNVDSAEVRYAAKEVAAQQPGVISVVNELEIVPELRHV
jgi:osmotically-inducible protein OsmY